MAKHTVTKISRGAASKTGPSVTASRVAKAGRITEIAPSKERANELVRSIGLKPIKGRSGPRVAY